MLTWAIAWLIRNDKFDNALHLLFAMAGDVSIAWAFASAFTGK